MTTNEAEVKAKSLIESGEEDTDVYEILVAKFLEDNTELETEYAKIDAEIEQLTSLYEKGLLQPEDL